MNNKVFIAIIGILVIGGIGFAVLQKEPPKPRLGIEQANEGQKHVAEGQPQTYKAKIPTSGPHAGTVQWQAYEQQIPDENIIHNMEHGGIIVSYRSDLDSATIQKLKGLFAKPYTVQGFSPNKAIVMPRKGQEKPIVLASWNRILELDNYNQQSLIDYYLGNVNKSPEPNAR